MAISSPLLEASIDGAHGVLLSISGGSDLGLFEINEAAQLVAEAAHPEANIIFGAVIDDALGDEVRVTVIAAGFDGGAPLHRGRQPGARHRPGPVRAGAGAPPRRPRPARSRRRRRSSGHEPATSTDDDAVVTEHTEPTSSRPGRSSPRRRAPSPSTRTTTSTCPTSSSSPRDAQQGRAGPSGPPLARLR